MSVNVVVIHQVARNENPEVMPYLSSSLEPLHPIHLQIPLNQLHLLPLSMYVSKILCTEKKINQKKKRKRLLCTYFSPLDQITINLGLWISLGSPERQNQQE